MNILMTISRCRKVVTALISFTSLQKLHFMFAFELESVLKIKLNNKGVILFRVSNKGFVISFGAAYTLYLE